MPTQQPSPTATSSTFQVGTYNSLTDTFTSVFDLNDGATTNIMWNTLRMPQPEKAFVRSFNLRAPGERVTRFQYKNRHIQVSVSLRGASVQAILTTCHSLIAAIENPPYRLRLALPNATQYAYATVVAVTHNIPADPQTLLAKALPNVQIDFECAPGLLGDRVTLQNLVVNPGFEAPSGPAVTAFSDACANAYAYVLQAGGAVTGPASTTWVDVVAASMPYRFLRLGESSGTTAIDIGGTNNPGTSANCTLGTAGLVSGDTDTAYTFNGTTSKVTIPTTGLATGNSAMTMGCGFQISAIPTAIAVFLGYGNATTTAHQNIAVYITTTGKLQCDVAGGLGTITGTTTITTNARHLAEIKWDGTTLTLYLDGVSQGTSTPGAQAIPASPTLTLGTNVNSSNWYSGILDEFFFYNAADSNQSTRWTAFSTGASGTQANTLSVPAAAQVAFGSPAWGACNTWQTRFRWVSGLTATWYLHYTDANNYLAAVVSGTALTLNHVITGTTHQLATSTIALTHEAWYWLQITQFPIQASKAPFVQATLLYDDSGAVGAAVTSGAIGPVATSDGATALQGRPQIAASGAALVVGGNYTGVHTLALFGPGGWTWSGLNGTATGAASLGWEHAWEFSATTYTGGPVRSNGAARIDCPPAGTVDARLATWDGTGGSAGAIQYGIPTAQNHVLGLALAYKTTASLSATSAVNLLIGEYNSSGTLLTTGTVAVLTGAAQTAWTAYSDTYTVSNAATAFVRVQVQVTDTTANSANATVWVDNVQGWDQTSTGQTSMPYCELRFPQGPAQLMVSGLVGDLPAPAFVATGGYMASWPLSGTLTLLLGRRALAHPQAQLIRWPLQPGQGAVTPLLDSGSYGGVYVRTATGQSGALANVLIVAPSPAANLGAYHFVERVQTSQSAGNLANVSSRLAGFEGVTGIFSNQVNAFNAYVASQFSAAATWTLVDHGTLFVPLFTAGALTDISQQYEYVYGQWTDSTGGGSQFSLGVSWLLPIDADVLGATLLNPSNAGGAVTNAWVWTYNDAQGLPAGAGSGFAWGFSLETAALPAPAHAVGGPGTTSSGQISINPSATPYLTLDPLAGANAGVSGVNQAVGSLMDQSGALLPLHCEMQYTPLYLYPR